MRKEGKKKSVKIERGKEEREGAQWRKRRGSEGRRMEKGGGKKEKKEQEGHLCPPVLCVPSKVIY